MGKEELFAKDSILDKPELYNLRVLFFLNMFLLVTDFLMPQYFGVHLGWDFTCTRFADIFLVIYGLLHTNVFNMFMHSVVHCLLTVPLVLYLIVASYTMVFRADINALMLPFLEILTFYMLIFAARYVIGVRRSLKIVIFCAYFLSAYGFLEFAAGQSLYLKFLRTVPTAVQNCYRSGYYRIMGPCGHPLGYGLLLILFVAVACIDLEHDRVFLYQRPILLLMLIANVFLTGSRSSQGIVAIELVVIILFSDRTNRKKAWLYTVVVIVAFALFIAVTYNTSIGRYLMLQITMLIDQIFDTEFSINFGADMNALKNSEGYREFLPYIFKLDWLNPFVGRGVKQSFGAEFVTETGLVEYIESIDNFYVSQYIKYAYPGMISYIAFILSSLGFMIYGARKYRSGIMTLLCIGFLGYFVNLWYLDSLQTQKFMYVIVAIFCALYMVFRDIPMQQKKQEQFIESITAL